MVRRRRVLPQQRAELGRGPRAGCLGSRAPPTCPRRGRSCCWPAAHDLKQPASSRRRRRTAAPFTRVADRGPLTPSQPRAGTGPHEVKTAPPDKDTRLTRGLRRSSTGALTLRPRLASAAPSCAGLGLSLAAAGGRVGRVGSRATEAGEGRNSSALQGGPRPEPRPPWRACAQLGCLAACGARESRRGGCEWGSGAPCAGPATANRRPAHTVELEQLRVDLVGGLELERGAAVGPEGGCPIQVKC